MLDREALRIFRKARRLSQAQVARLAGIGTRTYQAIETGENSDPGIRTLSRICAVLDISLLQILRWCAIRRIPPPNTGECA